MKLLHGLVDGQVLQRLASNSANAKIIGESGLAGEITATIFQGSKPLKGWTSRKVGSAAKGEFAVELKGIPVGGPYRLVLSLGAESVTIKAFYVGDVWIMAGQSNMEGVGRLDQSAKPHPLIRVFSMRHEWKLAKDPLHTLAESPDEFHNGGRQLTKAEVVKQAKDRFKGVGVGIFFAQEMLKRSGVPQGLLATAHGGTSMAQWNPALKKEGGKSLYYSMFASVKATGQPVAGMLWYQGESDANPTDVPLYTERMQKLVAATRKDFNLPSLPWIIVQLGRYVAAGLGEEWSQIRELERTLPSKVRNLATVPAIDLSLDDGIHISSEGYAVLGLRMAAAAARLVHGDKRELPQPQLLKIHPLQNLNGFGWVQDVEFTNVKGKLIAPGEPHGFGYTNPEHKIQPNIYRTTLHGNKVRLHLNLNPVLENMRIGYGLGLYPICNITDERGFSLPAFGPLEIGKPRAILPFMAKWKVTDVISGAPALEKLKAPDFRSIPHEVKVYEESNGFIQEHVHWQGKTGQAYFAASLELAERMDLKFLFGYDGPIRIWVDGKPFFIDLAGTNPALTDAKNKSIVLKSGRHEVTIAMDINGGQAWGFFMRFERNGLSAKQIRDKNFVKPTYSV